jgi:pSer/pThr/pTyr-binding forkhead associated (FHA) protein
LAAPVVVIGRGTPSSPVVPDIDLGHAPADIGVSRGQHAVLERQPDGRYALVDAASTNGTFLNDLVSPIPSGVRTMLEDGDRVYLGHFSRLLVRRRTD